MSNYQKRRQKQLKEDGIMYLTRLLIRYNAITPLVKIAKKDDGFVIWVNTLPIDKILHKHLDDALTQQKDWDSIKLNHNIRKNDSFYINPCVVREKLTIINEEVNNIQYEYKKGVGYVIKEKDKKGSYNTHQEMIELSNTDSYKEIIKKLAHTDTIYVPIDENIIKILRW